VAVFRQGLREGGLVEDQDCAIEYRWADNQLDRLPALVADLLRRSVAVILGNTPSALAAKASCRPLHGLSYRMGVSEIILVPLPKRLCIRGRNLLHIVTKPGNLTTTILCPHSSFAPNQP